MVRMRLEPQDDYLHAVEAASNFNESRYYNFFDPGAGMGGWVRMGNRPNEGYAEMTVCLYLPDGRSRSATSDRRSRRTRGPRRRRPALRGGRALRGAPHHLRRQGVRARATRARWPIRKSAFNDNPHAPCTVDLAPEGGRHGRGAANPSGRRARRSPTSIPRRCSPAATPSSTWRSRHGHRRRRDVRRSPTALGLRDHSWGPRFWQNIWWYRWLTVNLGPKLGFALTISGAEDDPDAQPRRRLPVRQRPLRRRPLGDDPQLRADFRLRQRVVPDEEPRSRSRPTTTCTRSTATCGRTSRCAIVATTWSRGSPRA